MNTLAVNIPRISVLIAWCLILIGSALPELALGYHYPLELTHWLSLTKIALFIFFLLLSFKVRVLAAVRALLIMLLTLQVASAGFGELVSSAFWRQQVQVIESPFIRQMLSVQFVRVGVTLAVLAILFVVFRDPSRFYLGSGDMKAKASRVIWLGISGKSSWIKIGTVLTIILSMGTLTFLSLGMPVAIPALSHVVGLLPFILLFSVTNALGEEISFRIALLAPVKDVVPPGHAMLMSATYFGLAHYYGIPSGSVGVIMAGFLGWLACRSVLDTKGIGWAFIMHVVQDVWIFWFMAVMFSLSVK